MMTLARLVSLLWACTIAVSRSYVIQPGTWRFRGHPIAYETAKTVQQKEEERDPTPVLLLNGFGVGSFHQHRLIHEMLGEGDHADRRIYCIDYLGQGRSWPEGCQDGQGDNEIGLRYCGGTWVEQITGFIEEVILPQHPGMKIHLVGNSLGGHLAAFTAAARPDLVKSLGLLNATPVWGANLPGWDGQLPAPWFPKIVGRYLFDRVRDLNTIEQYLKAAYGNSKAFDTELVQQIRACTDGAGGHAAFTSILWSPPVSIQRDGRDISSFYDALQAVDCDVLLLFGAKDPWCKPAFAKRMLQRLKQRSSGALSRYIEVDGVGHCPNHEAPKATAMVLDDWWRTADKKPSIEGSVSVREAWGETSVQERSQNDIPLSLVDRLAVTFV